MKQISHLGNDIIETDGTIGRQVTFIFNKGMGSTMKIQGVAPLPLNLIEELCAMNVE